MALRLAAKSFRASFRRYASTYEQMIEEEKRHAAGSANKWQYIVFFVACPAMAYCAYNAYSKEVEHMSHPRADFVAYPHLRIRSKPFPWGNGNRTLFHNPLTNALPDGYEVEDPRSHHH